MVNKMKTHYLKKSSAFAVIFLAISITLLSFKSDSPSTRRADYNVTIVNKYWASMRLQVRVGNQPVAENNTLVKDIILKRNESVTVPYDVICYYRRDANPDNPDAVTFTTWTGAGCFRNKTCIIDNP
jgi:hypothetical protein